MTGIAYYYILFNFNLNLQVLSFMKFVTTSRFRVTNLVALTSWSIPDDLYKVLISLSSQVTPMVSLGLLVAFPMDTGFDAVVWALDLPDVERLSDIQHRWILNSEIRVQARHRGAFVDTFVSYSSREGPSDSKFARLVSALERMDSNKITTSRSFVIV